jgi:hypothetical protein
VRHREDRADEATVYRRGETAEATLTLPGWTFAVDDLFE